MEKVNCQHLKKFIVDDGVRKSNYDFNKVVDISCWQVDDSYGDRFPKGARDKYAVISPMIAPFMFIKSNYRYLFKKSFHRYPEQFWIEVVASIIGDILGVRTPATFPSINQDNEECGALIEWFYSDTMPRFMNYYDGGDLLEIIIENYDLEKGTHHNLESVIALFYSLSKSGKFLFPTGWAIEFFKMLLFDAIIGNTDRHQDNWGLAVCYLKTKKTEGVKAVYRVHPAPAFDNGTSLGHEILERKFVNFTNPQRIYDYIHKGKPHMKWALEDDERISHFDFIGKIVSIYPNARNLFLKLLSFDIIEIQDALLKLTKIDIPVPLTEKRVEFMIKLISERRGQLLIVIGE